MSNESPLHPQASRLGEAFLEPVEDEERQRLELKRQELTAKEQIAEATGIRDERLLAELAGLGIRVETLSALTLIPLVLVAWADGQMDEAERESALAGAESVGVDAGSIAYRMLEIWLMEAPPPDLGILWQDFIRALCDTQSADENARMRENLLGRARAVAAAAGDARRAEPHVSAVEAECLDKLATAFDV